MDFAKLTTQRGKDLPEIPWDVHPMPQLRRERYQILNGEWDYAAWEQPQVPPAFPQ